MEDDDIRAALDRHWAASDANDFEIVAANLLDHDPRRVSQRIAAYALYIDPPLGRVGMTWPRLATVGGGYWPASGR